MIEYLPALLKFLNSDSTIDDFLNGRIFPMFVPQGDPLPALVWTIDGVNREPRDYGGLAQSFMDLELHQDADKYEDAEEIAERIRLRLDDKSGDMEGFFVDGIFLDNHLERYVPPTDGDGVGTAVFIMEFTVWFRELAATC